MMDVCGVHGGCCACCSSKLTGRQLLPVLQNRRNAEMQKCTSQNAGAMDRDQRRQEEEGSRKKVELMTHGPGYPGKLPDWLSRGQKGLDQGWLDQGWTHARDQVGPCSTSLFPASCLSAFLSVRTD